MIGLDVRVSVSVRVRVRAESVLDVDNFDYI